MNIFFDTFVEKQREFSFTDDLGHGANGAEISCRQSCQRIYIVLTLTVIPVSDDVARHIDEKHAAHPNIDKILLQDIFDSIQLFLTERV
jgi:hypothetical protein